MRRNKHGRRNCKCMERKLHESETTLIKSGFVATTPSPYSKPNRGMPSNKEIQSMDWDDIHDFVSRMEGK